ncbi:MAG: LLM class flavin-dependent oxidoreductase [Solirubrobacterales bacterium]|nr:LLM class flavin-dependent oxidoreductase [Solirubrobacterales bacterium]
MELGVVTFADNGSDYEGNALFSGQERMKNLIEEAELADQVGLDVFGVGEHHRPDFTVSSPTVALAAIAARTKNIRLTSAVTVLSSADPVRVYEEFATLDLISGGRAEIMAGRGSFTETFPLFGQSLDDYDELFVEHLELLLKIRENEYVTWQGKHRPSIDNRGVFPRAVQEPLPVWIAVGGSPESVARAGLMGLPLTIAIIGGTPDRFIPLVKLYRRATEQAGHEKLPLAINSHVFVSESPTMRDDYYEYYSATMNKIGRERGWPPMDRAGFDARIAGDGIPWIGEPEAIAEKILREHELFGNTRFLAQGSMGRMPHDVALKSIELFGTKVAPLVREEVARSEAGSAQSAPA